MKTKMKNDGIKEIGTKSIAYGLWLNEDIEKSFSDVDPRDLTLSWLRFGYQGNVIESVSIDEILQQAVKEGFNACLIQRPGNIISEDWMLPHWGKSDFHECVAKHFHSSDFLICANYVQNDSAVCIDTNCFLVNLELYQQYGCPQFGAPTSQLHSVHQIQIQQQNSNKHAQPLMEIRGTGLKHHIKPNYHGWQLIDTSIENALTVPELPQEIFEKRLSLVDISKTQKEQESSLQKRFLDGVETQLSRGKSGIFLWNIESYDDVPIAKKESDNTVSNNQIISNLYCVAAGFKPNMLLHRHGFDSNTTVTFFDYSPQALKIRKTLINEWDGLDYPSFCKQLMQRFPSNETFYQLWNGINPEQINWDDVEILWQRELSHWGGSKAFQKQWLAQQQLNYQFVHGDVVNTPQPILETIKEVDGCVIWWSNAFFTISSNWLMSIEQRKARFHHWVNQLSQRSPNSLIYGADHNNSPINGVSAFEYDTQINQPSNQYNELTPQRFAARALRF